MDELYLIKLPLLGFERLTSDGGVWVWGGNRNGELANGTTDSQAHPVPVRIFRLGKAQGLQSDADDDGLALWQEWQAGTDPNNFDSDGDGMSDGWEVRNGTNPLVNDASGDINGNGMSNLDEYQMEAMVVQVVSGNDQPSSVDEFLPQPLVIQVTDVHGQPLANSLVVFQVTDGQLSQSNDGNGLSSTIQLRTDSQGKAQVYFKQPSTPGTNRSVTVRGGTTSNPSQVTTNFHTGTEDYDYGGTSAYYVGPLALKIRVASMMVAASKDHPVLVTFDDGPFAIDNAVKNETTGEWLAGGGGIWQCFNRDAPVPKPFILTENTILGLYNDGATTSPFTSPASLHFTTTPIKIEIAVDTNRDGTVDDNDKDGKDDITATKGALLMVNCDADGKTSVPDAVTYKDDGTVSPTDGLIKSNGDEMDLSKLVVKATKVDLTSAGVKMGLKITDKDQIKILRIYKKRATDEKPIWGPGVLENEDFIDITPYVNKDNDTEFGIESLMFAGMKLSSEKVFDGNVEIQLGMIYSDGTFTKSDAVKMRVTPWLMNGNNSPSTKVFVGPKLSLGAASVVVGDATVQWTQDQVEIGYTQIPGGPATTVTFRLPYGAPLPAWPTNQLLGANLGVFTLGTNFLDSASTPNNNYSGSFGGNLELLPSANSLGNIVYGDTMSANMVNFLNAQCLVAGQPVQPPISVPTKWLAVGHVDEMLGFLGPNQVVVASPQKAYGIMTSIRSEDWGGSVLFSTNCPTITGTVQSSVTAQAKLIVADDLTGVTPDVWQYVRLYSGIGAGYVGHVSQINKDPDTGNFHIIADKVWNTGSTVLPTSDNPNCIMKYMDGATDGISSWPPIMATDSPPTQYVLVQNSLMGRTNDTPVFITVQEVLSDAELQKVNLGTGATGSWAADQIASATNKLARAGVSSFTEVPVLFYGNSVLDFETKRSAVAITPGLANCQPVGSSVYFPKPYGVFDKNGNDLFEQSVSSFVSGAVFLDDWKNYHLWMGEVHCGSSVQRTPPANWWQQMK